MQEQKEPSLYRPSDEPAQGIPTGLEPPEASRLQPVEGRVVWTASEFVAHHKNSDWYLALGVGAVVLATLLFAITRDIVVSVVVVVGAGFFGFYASHPPRQRRYVVDSHGLSIDEQLYKYSDFRYFSVVPEGAFSTLVFMPLKRFGVITTVHYAPEDEEKILGIVSVQLPYEDPKNDAIDNLMRRIRF